MKLFRKTDAKITALRGEIAALNRMLATHQHFHGYALAHHEHPDHVHNHDHDFLHEHPMLAMEANPKRRVEGTVACPQCAKSYEMQADLHMGVGAHVRLRCECGADLSVTSEGVSVK